MTTPTQYAALHALQRGHLKLSNRTILDPGPSIPACVATLTAKALHEAGWAEIQDTHTGRWLVLTAQGRSLLTTHTTETTALKAMTAALANKPVSVPTSRSQYDALSSNAWLRLCKQLPGGERTPTEGRNAHIDRVYTLCVEYHASRSTPCPRCGCSISVPSSAITDSVVCVRCATTTPKEIPVSTPATLAPTQTCPYLALEQSLVPTDHPFYPDLDGTIATLFKSEHDYLPRTLEELTAYVEGGRTWVQYHQSHPYTLGDVVEEAQIAAQETPMPTKTKPESKPKTPKPTIASLTAEVTALRDELAALKKANAEYVTAYDANQQEIAALKAKIHAMPVPGPVSKPVATPAPKPQPKAAPKVTSTASIPSDDALKGMKAFELANLCTAHGIRLPNGAGHSALFRLLMGKRDGKPSPYYTL